MKGFFAIFFLLLTIGIYETMKKLYVKFYTPFMLPIVTGTTMIICTLLIFDIPYDFYMLGGQWIVDLLGPAVVALAYPLYKQREILKKYGIPITAGVIVGTVVGIVSGIELSKLLKIETLTMFSLVPKSVTSPVAMDIAKVIGASPTLAAVFVMVAGIIGAVLGPYLIKWCKIQHFLGKGIGFGVASHGIGTARALEFGEEEGAISSIAMTISAVVASFVTPFFVNILL